LESVLWAKPCISSSLFIVEITEFPHSTDYEHSAVYKLVLKWRMEGVNRRGEQPYRPRRRPRPPPVRRRREASPTPRSPAIARQLCGTAPRRTARRGWRGRARQRLSGARGLGGRADERGRARSSGLCVLAWPCRRRGRSSGGLALAVAGLAAGLGRKSGGALAIS
jgi:hypothetical protein